MNDEELLARAKALVAEHQQSPIDRSPSCQCDERLYCCIQSLYDEGAHAYLTRHRAETKP